MRKPAANFLLLSGGWNVSPVALLMIEHVRKVLGEIKRVVPGYDPSQGYEMAGFIWFQGFDGLVSSWTHPEGQEPGGYDMPSALLADFIRDLRKDLSAAKMPFVIGVMGLNGIKMPYKNELFVHKAQAAPAFLPQFQDNVIAVGEKSKQKTKTYIPQREN